MQTLPKPRLRRLNIRLSQQEWERVKSLSSNTTCRNVSEYARLLLLDRPVRVFYGSPSIENFEHLAIRLTAELDDFGAAHEGYAKKTEEIKEAILKIADFFDPKPI